MTPTFLARLIAWLLLAAMPFHTLTAISLDLRGPAHFHLHDDDDDEDHDHPHGHAGVERHHHASPDASVVNVADLPAHDDHALAEGTLTGWSATMCVALVSGAPALPGDVTAGRAVAPDAPLFHSRCPGRLERPPQPASA